MLPSRTLRQERGALKLHAAPLPPVLLLVGARLASRVACRGETPQGWLLLGDVDSMGWRPMPAQDRIGADGALHEIVTRCG